MKLNVMMTNLKQQLICKISLYLFPNEYLKEIKITNIGKWRILPKTNGSEPSTEAGLQKEQ